MSRPRPLLEVVAEYLDGVDQPYATLPDQTALAFDYQGHNGRWVTAVETREEQRQILVFSSLGPIVPSDRRPILAELLARINYALVLGHFDLDFSDGELRYKTSVDLHEADIEPPPGLIQTLLVVNLTMTDHHLPALHAAAAGGTAEEALAHISI